MQNLNFYSVLGVAADSEDVVIAAAYKALMRKYHPDTNTDEQATAKAKQINEAYATLSDPIKRATYDRLHGFSSNEKEEKSSTSASDQSDENSDANSEAELENAQNQKLRHVKIVGLVLGIAALAAVFSGAFDNSTSTYSNETEDLYAFDDTTTDSAASAVDAAAAAAAAAAEQAANSIAATSETDPNLATLGFDETEMPKRLGPQTNLSFLDIEKAVNEFDRVLSRSGISGAKSYSLKCHEAAKLSMEWSKFDFCVAFDLSAAYLDDAISQSEDVPPNPYFSFMEENATNQYVGAQFITYAVEQRVSAIKRAIRPILIEKMSQKQATEKSETAQK